MKPRMRCLLVMASLSAVPAVGWTAAGKAPVFAEQAPPPAPDYGKVDAWAALPGRPGAASAVAPGATPAAKSPAADVFFVNPTTYRSSDKWNQDIADVAANGWTDASVIARQAAIFNGCCRIFAPRYRQGSSLSFKDMACDGGRAFDLAYGDVERAFDYYLRHYNHGRPFILASHSQGSFHLARLLEKQIDGKPVARRMVAAYVIGFNLSEGDFPKSYRSIPICVKPAQTGCIIGWNAVLDGNDLPARAAAGEQRYIERYGDDLGKTMLCINPLTFDRARPVADASVAKGAVPGDPGYGPIRPLAVHAVSARCENGLLVVRPEPALELKPLPGGSMHYHDFGLFYADVRANAMVRVRAWQKKAATSR